MICSFVDVECRPNAIRGSESGGGVWGVEVVVVVCVWRKCLCVHVDDNGMSIWVIMVCLCC